MEEHARVEFVTEDTDAEEEFVREYVLDAVERLPGTDDCERFVYIRAGHADEIDDGLVVVDIYGDPDAVIESERETWNLLVDGGVVEEWSVPDLDLPEELADAYGEAGAKLHERLRYLAGRMSVPVYGAFDDPPSPADAYPDEGEFPVGWWLVLHILSNQQGYTLEEEVDAYRQGIRNNLKHLVDTRGEEYARDVMEDLTGSFEDAIEERRERGRPGEGDETGEDS